MKIRKNQILEICFLILAALVIYKLFMEPRNEKIKAMRYKNLSEMKLFDARKTMVDNIEQLKGKNAEIRDRLNGVEKKFIRKSQVNEYLHELDFLADECQCVVTVLNPQPAVTQIKEGIEKIDIRMTIVGEYLSIDNFIGKLTNGEPVVLVDFMEIQREKEGDSLKASFVFGVITVSDV